MDEKIKYFKLWQEAVKKTANAMKNGDVSLADQFQQEMEDAYERYREASDFEDSIKDASFATLNMALESAIPSLFLKNKKAVKNCIKLIKEDKNLSTQFKFYNALKSYNGNSDVSAFINESLDLVSKDINLKTLKESNAKLANFIIKNNIRPKNELTEADTKFANSCDYLLSHKKKLSNINEFVDNVKVIGDYVVENKKNIDNSVNVLAMAEQVEKKINSLNEAEQSLVNDIMNAKTPVAESRREKLFNKIRNECIEKINKLVSENEGEEKERLLNLKETIMLKEYNKDTIVKDIAKLLEIGSVLSDSDHDKYM